MINRFITIGIFSTLFISGYVFFKQPFEFYVSYFVIILLLPLFILKFPFPFSVIKILLPLLLLGLISVYVGNDTIPLLLKIFINLFVSILFYNYVFQFYDFNIITLVKYYMIGAFIVALIGVIQLISFQIGFKKGYDFSWIFNKWSFFPGGLLGLRVNSVFTEPSYFGASMAPAFFISIYSIFLRKQLFLKKYMHFIIIFTYFLTASSVAFAGILFSILLLLVNIGFVRYIVVFIPILLFTYMYIYNTVPEFKVRVDGLSKLYSGEAVNAFEVHGSSFVQYNNFHVALENFKRNPFFGTGLGSHPIAYDNYSLVQQYGGIYDFNNLDANSMFLRLMSETGLYGILLIMIFIVKFFVVRKRDNSNELYWVISSAALIVILLQLFRQGNYTYNGFMFYMWLYYYTFIGEKNLTENKINSITV